jgi:hypothetical protein
MRSNWRRWATEIFQTVFGICSKPPALPVAISGSTHHTPILSLLATHVSEVLRSSTDFDLPLSVAAFDVYASGRLWVFGDTQRFGDTMGGAHESRVAGLDTYD